MGALNNKTKQKKYIGEWLVLQQQEQFPLTTEKRDNTERNIIDIFSMEEHVEQKSSWNLADPESV